MKKFVLIVLMLMFAASGVVFAVDSDIDIKINSLYAANKVDEVFNTILSIPQEERTSQQWLILGNIMQDMDKVGDAEFMYEHALN